VNQDSPVGSSRPELKVFVSSSGDVAEEWLITKRIIAAFGQINAESSVSARKGSSAHGQEADAVDRSTAWWTGLALFCWYQARADREEQDERIAWRNVRDEKNRRS
jgi:hypothetical protein